MTVGPAANITSSTWCLLGTEATLKEINAFCTLTKWRHGRTKTNLTLLSNEIREPIALEGTIFYQLSIGNICIQVQFGVVRPLTVDVPLEISFDGRNIRNIIHSERNRVHCSSFSTAILATQRPFVYVATNLILFVTRDDTSRRHMTDIETTHQFYAARWIVISSATVRSILNTTSTTKSVYGQSDNM